MEEGEDMKTRLILVFVIVILFCSFAQAEDYTFKVIVNASNQVSSIEMADVYKIFLKKKSKWEGGKTVKPVDQPGSSVVRKAFSDEALGKSVSAVKSYWQQQIFSGRGVPPPEKKTDQDVIDYVKENPGGIGYVSLGVAIGDVKVISISD